MSASDPVEQKLSISDAVGLGLQLHREGRLSEAEGIYREILRLAPDQPDALHFLGLLSHQLGRSNEAVQLIRKATFLAPDYADAHNNLGNVLKEMGRLDEAAAAFRKVIALSPKSAGAHNNLGVVLKEQGDLAGAAAAYEKAIALQPDNADAGFNLGNVLARQKNPVEAIAAFEKVIRLKPDYAEAHFCLGTLYEEQGRSAEARDAFRRAGSLDVKHARAFFMLGNNALKRGALEDTIVAYRKALERDPDFANAYHCLAGVLNALGRKEEATAVWQQWLERDPENPVPRHMLAAASGENVPTRAGDDFVKCTFDGFAEEFEKQLTHLKYRAPDLVAAALGQELGQAIGTLDVLDAGCGTGWCGPFLRAYARKLTGLDLSKGMLAKARGREIYDELIEAELTRFLAEASAKFDLIASADTLVYFGDLGPVLDAAAHALRLNGCLVFTVEQLIDRKAGRRFRLCTHGRYSHSEEHVRAGLAAAGLTVRDIVRAELRMEAGKPVAGLVVTARKEAAD